MPVPLRLGEKQIFLLGDPEGQRIHQRILRVARLKPNFAADGRHAETISVVPDPANHTVENAPILCGFVFTDAVARDNRPKSQGIQHRNRPRAHGENIAQNSAYAGSRPLKRLYVTRVVVRFDLERRHQPVADIHHAGILARPLHHQLAARGQALQVHLARFVGAMLAPHHREDTQLRDVRLAPQDLLHPRVFFCGKPVLGRDFRRDSYFRRCRGHQAVAFAAVASDSTSDWKITKPSAEPSADSTARSGCGIRPATLRSRLQMPAMLWSEPLGLPAASFAPSGVV